MTTSLFLVRDALPPYAREATDSACKAALVLGWRADVLRRRPAARRRRISHSAQALPFASCTRAAARSACTQAALVLGSRANVLRRRPAARSPPAASPPRPVHHVDSCCCSRCLRAAAPCPPPCRALPRTVLTTPRPSHPQPSARNRPGERMSLLDEDTYERPDAEVLPLITPAAARATDGVRRISHATRSGQRRPVAKRSTGRGQGKGRRGRRRRGRTTPHIRHRSRAPRKHPVPHIRPTHVAAHHLLSLLLCFTHSTSTRPFTGPLRTAHRWRWCRRSSRRTRRPPRRLTRYTAPTLPRASEANSGHQRYESRAIWCHHSQSEATQRPLRGHSEALSGSSEVIRGTQRSSETTQRPLNGPQRAPQRPLRGSS